MSEESSSSDGEGRIQTLRRMLERRPEDSRLKFGLAVEYLSADRTEEGVRLLREYLSEVDDEGNGWGRLASALEELGRGDEARDAYRRGVEAARRHGHPSMAEEFESALDAMEDRG